MLGLGISLSKSAVASTEWGAAVGAFSLRVAADGGTVESLSCIKSDVKFLMQNP